MSKYLKSEIYHAVLWPQLTVAHCLWWVSVMNDIPLRTLPNQKRETDRGRGRGGELRSEKHGHQKKAMQWMGRIYMTLHFSWVKKNKTKSSPAMLRESIFKKPGCGHFIEGIFFYTLGFSNVCAFQRFQIGFADKGNAPKPAVQWQGYIQVLPSSLKTFIASNPLTVPCCFPYGQWNSYFREPSIHKTWDVLNTLLRITECKRIFVCIFSGV